MHIVLDTSVLIAAFRSSTGASRALLDLVPRGPTRLAVSSALYLEYEAVLTRPSQMAAHRRSRVEIESFLIGLATFADLVQINFRYRPQLKDPNDELVLEAAINGGAKTIVTHNVRDFLPAANLFGIEICTPGRILKEWQVL